MVFRFIRASYKWKNGQKGGWQEAIPFCCTIQKNLNALPAGTVLGVHDLDALSLQLIADAVGLREVLGLLGLVALHDQRVDGGIALAGDGGAAFGLGGLGLGIGFPHRCGLFQQGQGLPNL